MGKPRGRNLPCEICQEEHRYSYPDGQDYDGHEWSPIACSNTIYYLRNAQRAPCPTCGGTGVIVDKPEKVADANE